MKKKGQSKRSIFKLTLFLFVLFFISVTAMHAADLGDVNNDATIDIIDALLILLYHAFIIKFLKFYQIIFHYRHP